MHDREIFTDGGNILQISTSFYKDLYTSEKVNKNMQDKILGNLKTKLSKEVMDNLNAQITGE